MLRVLFRTPSLELLEEVPGLLQCARDFEKAPEFHEDFKPHRSSLESAAPAG